MKKYPNYFFVWITFLLLVNTLYISGITPVDEDTTLVVKKLDGNHTFDKDTIITDELQMDYPKSYVVSRPFFISTKYSGGKLLVSPDKLKSCYAEYTEIKVGFSSLGNRWKDIVYGMPYYGIGVGFYDFNSKQTGHPISAYLVQGGTLKAFSEKSILEYEWNFGSSFNWKTYDPVTNPNNKVIGAKANIYFAANLFYIHILSNDLDLNTGVTFNHVSNGATHMPNAGVNTISAFVGLTYHFNRERIKNMYNPFLRAPVYDNSRLISDYSAYATVRQRNFPVKKTGLSSKYVDQNFLVAGFSYALLHMPDYEYRYGGGIDFVYDESAGYTIKKIGERPDGSEITESHFGKTCGRFGLGFSARGDVVMPKYSVSGQIGYEVIKGKKQDSPFYQIFSVKVPLYKGVYTSFLLRIQEFSKAQYMFLGMGYMFDHKAFKFM